MFWELDRDLKKILNNFIDSGESVRVGESAPSFSAIDSDLNEFDFADYKSENVLLLFFPFSFTETCQTELCLINDELTFFKNNNIKVIALSVDSPFSLKNFKALKKIKFTLLSDFNKNISNAYGVLSKTFAFGLQGVSKRSVFLIKNHEIKFVEILDSPGKLPNIKKLKDFISA